MVLTVPDLDELAALRLGHPEPVQFRQELVAVHDLGARPFLQLPWMPVSETDVLSPTLLGRRQDFVIVRIGWVPGAASLSCGFEDSATGTRLQPTRGQQTEPGKVRQVCFEVGVGQLEPVPYLLVASEFAGDFNKDRRGDCYLASGSAKPLE